MSTTTATKRISAILATLALALTLTVTTATQSHAATRIGGIDMVQACRQQVGGFINVVHGNTATSWKCNYAVYGVYGQVITIRQAGLDLNRYCNVTYGKSYAAYTNYYSPYSWGCFR